MRMANLRGLDEYPAEQAQACRDFLEEIALEHVAVDDFTEGRRVVDTRRLDELRRYVNHLFKHCWSRQEICSVFWVTESCQIQLIREWVDYLLQDTQQARWTKQASGKDAAGITIIEHRRCGNNVGCPLRVGVGVMPTTA